MKRLRAAISFLTILPTGKLNYFEPVKLIPMFPIVGLIVGGLLFVFDAGINHIWPSPLTAILDVIFLVVITGALHIDGLGDAADGLFSHRPAERALEIMKDSRLGTMGLEAIFCALAAKGGALAAIDAPYRIIALIIIPAYARAGTLFAIRYLPYGRPEGGTGSDFFKSPLPSTSFKWLIFPVVLSVFLGAKCVLINGVFMGVTLALILFYKRKLNCVTGDMLGAMVEVIETVLFLTVAINFNF